MLLQQVRTGISTGEDRRYGYRSFLAALLLFACTSTSASAKGPWVVLKDCRLSANQANDADSFHIKAMGKEYIFRLYFVDAPETDASFPERVTEQAKYFGLSTTQTLQLGDNSRRYSKEKLMQQPFTVRTCMQDALGRSQTERFYAFIETGDGDLAELLVANGMARVHGASATPVGLSSPQRQRQKLQRLEREAKAAKVGAWGASIGRLTARLPKQPAKTGPDSFDAFFHPERLAAPAEAAQMLGEVTSTASANSATQSAAPVGKLDPNTATSEQLLAIPGVGPVMASRIIAARPFETANDLRKVKGIGAKTYEKVRPHFLDAAVVPSP